MLNTFEAAKEFGSVEIKPEHIILGVLKAKTGIAYKIINASEKVAINSKPKYNVLIILHL